MKVQKDRVTALYENHIYGRGYVENQIETIDKYSDQSVLLAGCGAGRRLFNLYFYGSDVTAVDRSTSAIEFIKEKFEQLDREPPTLINDDLAEVELADNKYDYILCHGVLHHTVNPVKILENLKTALKPEGVIELSVYHSQSFIRYERWLIEKVQSITKFGKILPEQFKQQIHWWDTYENPVWKTYSRDEAESMVSEADLDVVDTEVMGPILGKAAHALTPPLVETGIKRLFPDYRWYVRIDASK
jgi:SAM-dependent methyltransferase